MRPKKELIGKSSLTKTAFAKAAGISRTHLYYQHRQPEKDWRTKQLIESALRNRPSYGHKRLAGHLDINKKRILRVMKLYGIKPYRRRGKKWRKKKKIEVMHQNLLLTTFPAYRHHVWVADFTELWWKQKKIYVATVIDLFTREIVGVSVSLRKGTQLTLQSLWSALFHHSRPDIFHSDNGTDYDARVFTALLAEFGSRISRSHPRCPWENGYQESFYDKFKVDLGDPNRFRTLGELIYEIYQTIHFYNRERIHTKLKMPPAVFAERHQQRSNQIVQTVS